MNEKDYSKLPLDALQVEEKKIKRSETTAKFIIGFLVGVMIFGIANNGFGILYIFIPLILISGIYKHSQNQKSNLAQIQAEIKNKLIR